MATTPSSSARATTTSPASCSWTSIPRTPRCARLVRSDLPCVGVDVELVGPATEFVISDNQSGIALAMRHLHDLGHRRIATITGLLDTAPGAERLRAYRTEVQALGLAYRDEYVAYGDFYVDSGHRAMTGLLALPGPRPRWLRPPTSWRSARLAP